MAGDDVAVGLGVTVAVVFILVMGAICYIFVCNRHRLPGQASQSPSGSRGELGSQLSPVSRRSWVDEVDEVHDDVLKRLGIDFDQDSDEETAPPKPNGGRKRGGSSNKKRRSTTRTDRSTTGVEAFDDGGDDNDDGIIRSQHTRPQGLDIMTETIDDAPFGSFSWTPADTAASNTMLGPTRGSAARVASGVPEREPLTGGPQRAETQPSRTYTPSAVNSRSSISRTIVLRRESDI